MPNQETAISEVELHKIVRLLRTTDLTISEIAKKTGHQRGLIESINRRFKIRKRSGRANVAE